MVTELFKDKPGYCILPATPTPFDSDGRFAPAALAPLLRRNIAEGADGFFIGGSSGECFLLSAAERLALFETAAEVRAEAVLIAHVGAVATAEAAEYARAARRLGYDAIAATPPFYYRFSPADICRYYRDISEAAGMPVMVYNFPGNTGVEFDLTHPAFAGLFTGGVVWGVKHTDLNAARLERFLALSPDLQVFNGYDETMLAGLAFGARGSIGSTFNFMLPHFKEIIRLFEAGDLAAARGLQQRANDSMLACCAEGLIPSIKHVLKQQGYDFGPPRAPFAPLDTAAAARVDRVLEEKLWRGGGNS